MSRRRSLIAVTSWLIVATGLGLAAPVASLGRTPAAKPKERVNLAVEPMLAEWSAGKAAEYLDTFADRGETNKKCLNCHATYAYLLARPFLPAAGDKHAQRRQAIEDWARGLLKEPWSASVTEEKPVERTVERKISEALLTASVLAQHDAITSGQLQSVTRDSLDLVWRLQRPDGAWHWLKTTEPPSATDDHYGATMLMIGVGSAPTGYAGTPAAKQGLEKIRRYLEAHRPRHIHQRLMLLWADRCVGGILSDEERQSTVNDLLALQRPDGGWAMAGLADWKRIDRTAQNISDGDGYGTGLVVYVLRVAGGIPAEDARIQRAVQWMKTHQRQSGYWYTRSPKIDDELSTYVGTVYTVMALKECGQIPGRDPVSNNPAAR